MGLKKGKKEENKPERLGNGIFLYNIIYTQKTTMIPLLARGMVVFLIVFGSIGGFLSSFGMEYNFLVFAGIIFLISIFFSVIYRKRAVRNLGYLVFFIIFVVWAVEYRHYINSGFYALINEMTLTIADYFQQGGVNEYAEYFSNRYVTVTIMASFLGIVYALLLNISMISKIRVFGLVQVCVVMYFLPVYLEEEPGLGYVLCIMAGLSCAVLLKAGGHFKDTSEKKRKRIFRNRNSKKTPVDISYRQSPELWMQTIGFSVGMAGICILCISFLVPQSRFLQWFPKSSVKTTMDAYFLDIWQFGLDGVFGQSASGGIGKGQIGRTGSVRPDYETDLVIKFAPYSTDTLYLKAYTGIVYGENQWQSEEELLEIPTGENPAEAKFKSEAMYEEAIALNQQLKSSDKSLGQGRIRVKNIDADTEFLYYPYYTILEDYRYYPRWKKGIRIGEEREYTYYPLISVPNTKEKRKQPDKVYFDVPKKNEKAVADMCKEMELQGSQKEIIQQVVTYFEEKIPYTVRPGAVPKEEDVINYFLTKNKKGYCAHFASSAVLIFRYMGIPARYVEGYAVGYGQILEGTITEENYEDYYQGYSELGKTAVVEVEVSDASAHAWVEVFDEEFGWIPIEVTPSSSEDIEDTSDFWSFFGTLFGGSQEIPQSEDVQEHQEREKIEMDTQKAGMVLVIFCTTLFLIYAVKMTRKVMYFKGKNPRERVIAEYEKLCGMLRHLDFQFNECCSHKEQFEWMQKRFQLEECEAQILASFLEEISYSKEEIEEPILLEVRKKLMEIRKQIKKKLSLKEKLKVIAYFLI